MATRKLIPVFFIYCLCIPITEQIKWMNVYFSFISHNTGTFSQEPLSFDITQHNQLPTGGWIHMAQEVHYHSIGSTGLLEWTVTAFELRFWPMLKKTMLTENKPKNNQPTEVWRTSCRTLWKYVGLFKLEITAFLSTLHLSKMSSTQLNTCTHTLTGTIRSWNSLKEAIIHFCKYNKHNFTDRGINKLSCILINKILQAVNYTSDTKDDHS
jgi:hypothetical protein